MKKFTAQLLNVEVHQSRDEMARAASHFVEKTLSETLRNKQTVRVIFAAAPSQSEMLASLTGSKTIDWRRVDAFHMDEYIGLPAGAPQHFGVYLDTHLFSKVRFRRVHLIDGQAADTTKECRRYAELLSEAPIDLVCMGIGENGHIAFNDPPVADFHDPAIVKVVELDEPCRQQQVHDGCFSTTNDVPRTAFTVTVPALMSAMCLSVVVPGPAKAEAVRGTLEGPISTTCPASILRTHSRATLFLDAQSASRLLPGPVWSDVSSEQ